MAQRPALPSPQAAGAAPELLRPPAAPSGPVVLLLRGLIAVGLVLGWAHAAGQPVERSADDLLDALRAGEVTALAIERPGVPAQGQFRVEWTEDGRRAYAHYELSTLEHWSTSAPDRTRSAPDHTSDVDQGAEILDAARQSPVAVPVTFHEGYFGPTGLSWNTAGLAAFVALWVLVLGPQPRLATKWAWFWPAMAIPPLWLAFVVLEPVPLWSRTTSPPARRRLTGGWAFVVSLLLAPALAALVPGYADVFPNQ